MTKDTSIFTESKKAGPGFVGEPCRGNSLILDEEETFLRSFGEFEAVPSMPLNHRNTALAANDQIRKQNAYMEAMTIPGSNVNPTALTT